MTFAPAGLVRLGLLPTHCQLLVQARLSYSTASGNAGHPYAFPTQPRPTAHEIFHLPRGASEADIKKRYIELVKLHHPDAQSSRSLSPAERHRRFQMVSSAYETLHHKRVFPERDRDHSVWAEIDRRKRAQYRHSRRAEYEYAEWKNPPVDGRWTDRVILAFGFVALISGMTPMWLYPRNRAIERRMTSASAADLSEARKEARLKYEVRIREFEVAKEK
ncbi:hypothetical protein B0H16DRAFT_1504305 [Mycena metata]|uniref:J domain-containing protein n=1 Tax=Mycena metata TaxID=1033252 RepID=A0AAD7K4Q6_9AGAR|nr:hypothetical protein B0H16DRAFT_1504305 [Mycena metata]